MNDCWATLSKTARATVEHLLQVSWTSAVANKTQTLEECEIPTIAVNGPVSLLLELFLCSKHGLDLLCVTVIVLFGVGDRLT